MYVNKNNPQSEMTATPDKYPQGYFKEKKCRSCTEVFKPQAPSHLYCSQECTDIGFSEAYLQRNYKISVEDYKNMLVKQNKLCAICLTVGFKLDPKTKSLLVVDHCHKTGKVRGMLCHNCNRALGLLGDDKDRLKRAVDYLEGATTILKGSSEEVLTKRITSEMSDDIV